MKHIFKLPTIILMVSIYFLSCKKDKENEPGFDIKNPAGYVIAGTFDIPNLGNNVPVPIVFEFLSNQKLKIGYIEGTEELDYFVSNDTVLTDGIKLLIKNNKLTYFKFQLIEFPNHNLKILKKPDANALLGKTYTGSYYNLDNTVLHPNFFYGFHAAEDKVDAGYNVGTTVRTETYTSVANIGALVQGNGFKEFMLLDEGKLKAMYKATGGNAQYANLNPQ